MLPDEYQALAMRTAKAGDPMAMVHCALGLATEWGELQDPIKAALFYGKPLDVLNAVEECGDLLWYIAYATHELGAKLSDFGTPHEWGAFAYSREVDLGIEINGALLVYAANRMGHPIAAFQGCAEDYFYNHVSGKGALLSYLKPIYHDVAAALEALQYTPAEAMEKNIAKLRARYPKRFTNEDALNRNLAAERKALE